MLAQTLRISIPYLMAALGGCVCELSGVVNIALEGLLLTGAFFTVLVDYYTGSAWAGLCAALAAGLTLSWLHAVASIRFRVDQIISGLAVNLLAVGLTKFILRVVFHSSSNSARVEGLAEWNLPLLGPASPLLFAAVICAVSIHWLVYGTPFGLRLRAVGEKPQAAESVGVSVFRIRYAAVLLSGALCSLGGAYLALEQHQFTDGMSGGRGFIALAAIIFGRWRPLPAVGAALLFGFAEALQIEMQSGMGLQIPTQFVQMIPYLLTLVVVAGLVGKMNSPQSAGVPYERGQ